jgi:hypothetical protein
VYSVRAELVEALLDEEPFGKLRANGDPVRIQLLQVTSVELLSQIKTIQGGIAMRDHHRLKVFGMADRLSLAV